MAWIAESKDVSFNNVEQRCITLWYLFDVARNAFLVQQFCQLIELPLFYKTIFVLDRRGRALDE
jgi:hypothetical protein